ncbi:MAG: DUF2723 domain-containing protein [Flavobacteriales bacterium]|jgi:hypothetical protein|nr:DUF2723 domain-containing protein [Flavobacteriales bacterium]
MAYRKVNIITGWLVFLVAAWTYIRTIEPTASFWDCGEFIATAYKLQVGHPPGAPLFMILARVSSFFVAPETVPVAVNVLSALASAFTILFLFWSITHMAHKLATRHGAEPGTGGLVAVMGSGIVGALAYTWSDSFWFSAVEGEVYALSSFFTAIVFWAILKWESEAERPHSTRWLILIAYLMGLSIGVHLLNLLCIPAIAFVYYFKRYEVTRRGIVITFLVSALILGAIQAVIIPGIVQVAGWFELLFVNSFGLPFNSGTLVYALLLIGLIVWGLYRTQRRGLVLLNTIVLGVTVILIGYSTYAMIVIRSVANPPIDENNPENVFTLLSYLNREQYGDRPLLTGQFWDSPITADREDGDPVHTATWLVMKDGREAAKFYDRWSARHFVEENPGHTIDNKYIVTDPRKGVQVVYDPAFTMFFPRMYSAQRSHVNEYKRWSDFKGTPMRTLDREGRPTIVHKPTFGENLRFFMDYQVNWMYWRYFMWNFAGRQNDVQGHGDILSGNWISGIKAIDAQRLGNQDQLPPSMTNNKGRNKYYLLPLLLGIIGLVYQLVRHARDWAVVMLLFLFTGLAIVVYLNQTPFQPRERDYAYAGSFYAFAIWIGLGVFALHDAARSLTRIELLKGVGIMAGIGAIKFIAELMTQGDHGVSLSILYMAAVAGAALALMHLLGRVMRNDALHGLVATAIGLVVPAVMVADGWDDHDRSHRTPARDLAHNYLESCAPNAILFTNGDNDTFPLWYAQEVEGIRTDIRVVNLSLLNTDWYADQMKRKAYESDPVPLSMDPAKYRQGTRDVVAFIPQGDGETYRDLGEMMAFVEDDRNMQPLFQRGVRDAWFPTDRFRLPVDSATVFGNGTLQPADTAVWTPHVDWSIGKQYILKNHLMVLDMLNTNKWERPVYFAVTTGPDSYLNLQEHFQLEGLTYRLVPVRTASTNPNTFGRVATDVMYDNVVNKFLWGNMDRPEGVYLDENILRMTTNLRLQLSSLAEALIAEGRPDDARRVLDLSIEKMPEHNVPYDRIMLPTIEAYYTIGDTAKADRLAERLFTIMEEDMNYYMSLEPELAKGLAREMEFAHAVMGRLSIQALGSSMGLDRQIIQMLGDSLLGADLPESSPVARDLQERFERMGQAYEQKLMELRSSGRRIDRMRF